MSAKKPFWKTSEFWGSIAYVVGGTASVLAGLVTAPVVAAGAAVVVSAYTVARGITKAATGKDVLPALPGKDCDPPAGGAK